MLADNLDIQGISTVIMNYCQKLNKHDFDISILAGAPVNRDYLKICRNTGIRVIELPPRKQSPKTFYRALFHELKKGHYDIVHVHGNSATITVELFLAWLSGTKVRIAHSHNSTCSHMKAHKILKPFFNIFHTHGFACSKLAGKWLFGNGKFYVVPNGFETEKFRFSSTDRNRIRKELGLNEDAFVIGHVGKFNDQKNHPYLLKIFRDVAKKNSNAYLLLVGGGPDFEKINSLVKAHEFRDRIILYGESSETSALYSAMDIFVFPSKYEGLGIVLIEAQISGLPCIASDAVPAEAVISSDFKFLPLTKTEKWADAILKYYGSDRSRESNYTENKARIMKYDIFSNARYVGNLYKKFLSRR